jgi:hypothetical protein
MNDDATLEQARALAWSARGSTSTRRCRPRGTFITPTIGRLCRRGSSASTRCLQEISDFAKSRKAAAA